MASAATAIAGTQFAATAATPTTNDTNATTGFPSLTYTAGDTCEIVDLGEVGYDWNTSESNTICTDPVTRKKTRKVMKPFTLTLNFVKGDALQGILDTAFKSQSSTISIQITLPNGTDKLWCQVQTTKFPITFGSGEDNITVPVEFEPQNEWVAS
jgi:hypothetical protein